MILIDKYGRPLIHLRISVTVACNYACIYCHREGELGSKRADELKPYEIYLIAKAASELGIRKFKLTGGEPLLRDDIVEVVNLLNGLQPLDLALTTNGYFLSEYAYELKRAGLRRVNISIPSLRREIYREITGVDGLDKVLKGVKAAISAGFNPVKINYVLLRGFNENEFWDFVEYARNLGAILQVIELQPEGLGSRNYEKLHVDLSSFEKVIKEKASKVIYRRYMHNRPQYYVNGGIVEFVRPICNPDFCMHCTRLRITADGSIKTCLFLEPVISLRNILRNRNYDDDAKIEKIKEAIVKANELREPYYKESMKRGE